MPASILARGIERVPDACSRRAVDGINCMSPMAPLRRPRPGLVVGLDLDQRAHEQGIDPVRLGHRGDDLAVGRRVEQAGLDRGGSPRRLGPAAGSGYGTSSVTIFVDERDLSHVTSPPFRSVRMMESPSTRWLLTESVRPESRKTISARAGRRHRARPASAAR